MSVGKLEKFILESNKIVGINWLPCSAGKPGPSPLPDFLDLLADSLFIKTVFGVPSELKGCQKALR